MNESLWNYVLSVRENSPIVHNVTNYVVMNNTANALLSVGASPIMAHAKNEIEQMVAISGALVINIGTLDDTWIEGMRMAITAAKKFNKPWVLDPVGAGATDYRTKISRELIELHQPSVVRGNASEIMAVANLNVKSKGVDTSHETSDAVDAAKYLCSSALVPVVCISGATDYCISKEKSACINNGHPLMTKVTGLGCTATALIGAFCAVAPDSIFDATCAAMALMGIAGEITAEHADGPGSFQVKFLDNLYRIDQPQFNNRLKFQMTNVEV